MVTIGTQTWLGKNLNVDHFANGEIIPGAKTDEEWKRAGEQHQPAWCYYKNDPANGRTYGRLYNWYAVHDPRGLAPKGWHVPSDNEWTVLIDYLGGQNYAGKKMKSTSTWESFNGANGNGDNSSGITGLPSGYRHIGGMYASIGEYAFWWSSSESITGYAWGCHLFNSLGSAERHYQAIGIGFPVRCVRN